MQQSNVLISGGSGMIGAHLLQRLDGKSTATLQLVRQAPDSAKQLQWDPDLMPPFDARLLGEISAAVHLSGANIAGHRWTEAYKRELLESRTVPTLALAKMLAGLPIKPRVMVCASAVGFYGDRGEEVLTEESSAGTGFLPEICKAWESAASPAAEAGIRVVHLRFGVVLGRSGGALQKLLPLFKLGLGGRLGNGEQWMSWISLTDVVSAILFAIDHDGLSGAVNAVVPEPITNAEFTRAMGQALGRPAVIPAPAFAIKLAFGEMAQTVLGSQRVLPERLLAAGFAYRYPEIVPAILGETRRGETGQGEIGQEETGQEKTKPGEARPGETRRP